MTFNWMQGVFFAFLKCFGVEFVEDRACEDSSSSRNKKSFLNFSELSLSNTQTNNGSSIEKSSNYVSISQLLLESNINPSSQKNAKEHASVKLSKLVEIYSDKKRDQVYGVDVLSSSLNKEPSELKSDEIITTIDSDTKPHACTFSENSLFTNTQTLQRLTQPCECPLDILYSFQHSLQKRKKARIGPLHI
ncbi:unnamed protein product [Vicia faba]|uniref:Uncharacterized protein n=1 Tax=Vicia faba TaxID=3906 RepID=A0AAV0ZD96_VICFA|nr:unnamed protein product [Vicia faba]